MLTLSATATVAASRSASGVAARAFQGVSNAKQGFTKFGFGWSNAEAHSFAGHNIENGNKIEWSSGTPRTGACV